MEMIAKAGVDPKKYIRFYNLRNYDRINASATISSAEAESGVDYESARKEHDDIVGAGYDGRGEETGAKEGAENKQYQRYQKAASKTGGSKYDSVSQCYMLNGPEIGSIPWSDGHKAEIDAFVSEELYIHTKIMIADDRVVICGSANLNDRSQLGFHDSEIAVVIEDQEEIQSSMAGQPYKSSKFAASLRRQLFRKHMGLLEWQDWTKPNANFLPVDEELNTYDWGSSADKAVSDPLSPEFDKLWNDTAATNTEVFAKAFHPVPADNVKNWDQYKTFFADLFITPSAKDDKHPKPSKYKYGHVVTEEFPGGVEEVKKWLGRVRGTLVEMPLEFLVEVKDLARNGLELNDLTEEIYT